MFIVWNMRTFQPAAKCRFLNGEPLGSLSAKCVFDPLGDCVFVSVGSKDGRRATEGLLCLMDGRNTSVVQRTALTDALPLAHAHCAFSPDGNYLLYLGTKGCHVVKAQTLEPFGFVPGLWTTWTLAGLLNTR